MRSSVLLVQTGGTLDKDYPRTVGGYAFEIGEAASQRVLGRLAPVCNLQYSSVSVCRKDSLEITEADRRKLSDTIANADATKCVVTHGTSTMVETAAYLLRDSRLRAKTVVLCGAFKPERMIDSDAPFNVGVAVGAAQSLAPGVYVAMQGVVHRAGEVRQDPKTGSFHARL
eukprot:TRINITY_DN12070_c0_g1_i1.p1 TRINITY_DN12070_c0_g1~~TRINITY_DN12070_c0_g1_i1.p1  ORF type:complete len:171 (+),score=40.02 TRINITY_DN12070_c0_g1_i1:88-600(+)